MDLLVAIGNDGVEFVVDEFALVNSKGFAKAAADEVNYEFIP